MSDTISLTGCLINEYVGTVADNIRYGPKLKGKKLSDDEVYKLLALADLDSSFFNKSGGELSVGQAQRVALARTLANEPEVTAYILQIKGNFTESINHSKPGKRTLSDLFVPYLPRFCYLMSQPAHWIQYQHRISRTFL